METTDKKLTVSEQTNGYIQCLEKSNELWTSIYSALEKNYGWKTAEEIMDKEYYGVSCAIRKVINKYMCFSIEEHVNCKHEYTEI